MISIFCCWNPSVMEAVWAFFGCCFNYPNDWIANDWFFHDESCFKLSISTFRCFISLFSLSSSDWFVDELHLDGSFPWLFLMLSDISCSIVALCWVVVDIIALLDFFFFVSFPCVRFNMSQYKFFLFSRAVHLLLELLSD